jgi:integrase
MPAVKKFTDSFVRDLSFKKELAVVLKRRPDATLTQIDFFEKRRRGRAMVLTLTSTGNRIWSLQWYQDGRPKRKKVAYWCHSDAAFPQWNSTQMRDYVDGLDIKKEIEEKLPDTFESVSKEWMKRHVQARGVLTEKEIQRHLDVYVLPKWRTKKFVDIRRIEVNRLLDDIVDDHGNRMADVVLTTLRSMMNWYVTRDGNYVSPIVKGMKRDTRPPEEKERTRVLNNDEIVALWKACAEQHGDILKLLLLTGQRKAKIAEMRWADVDDDGVWSVPSDSSRRKGTISRVKLPQMALDLIDQQPRIVDNPYVFASRGTKNRKGHFNGWDKPKKVLDKVLKFGEPWIVHDLRRTHRSLLSALGVQTEVGERVLGHKQKGVVGIYNRYEYDDEKSDALERVAAYIEGITHPRDNVASLQKERKRRAKKAA